MIQFSKMILKKIKQQTKTKTKPHQNPLINLKHQSWGLTLLFTFLFKILDWLELVSFCVWSFHLQMSQLNQSVFYM